MSRVHRLKVSDRMFFVTVNLRQSLARFTDAEYALIAASLDETRRRLGIALCGYVLMPDHWHALLWPHAPVTISRVVHDVKLASARRVNQLRERDGSLWQHQFWDRFVRHSREYGAQRVSEEARRLAMVEFPEFQPGTIGAGGVPD